MKHHEEQKMLKSMILEQQKFIVKSGRNLKGYIAKYGERGQDNYIADLSELVWLVMYSRGTLPDPVRVRRQVSLLLTIMNEKEKDK